ncbi:hypothetical protein [Pseudoclavibacter albus]|uniref:hypothetical protein n=1 Tax=Pseudoclavibacter albus TaxID=272241 RepID=UPI000826490F|nr:hypothetical protein [Pseudoclavibacter alba]
MTDYAAFAAEYEGDESTELDSTFGEESSETSILGEAPTLDDASWDAMLNNAYDAPAGANGDLLAEFASSITGMFDSISETLGDIFGDDLELAEGDDADMAIDDAWDNDPSTDLADDGHDHGHDTTDDLTETNDDFCGTF